MFVRNLAVLVKYEVFHLIKLEQLIEVFVFKFEIGDVFNSERVNFEALLHHVLGQLILMLADNVNALLVQNLFVIVG